MRWFARSSVIAAAAAAVVVAVVSPASAHVSVQPEGAAAQGGYATVNVKVPNERDNASTTQVEVVFPDTTPLASVMPEPVPGWDIKVTKSKLDKPLKLHGENITEAVSKVTWQTTGKGIAPGYFQKFPLSVGQLPTDTDQLVLKALQTYSNKEVVRWIEPQTKGEEEPEHPAPVLALSPASDDEHAGASASPATQNATSKSAASKAAAPSGDDGTARGLGIAGIAVGVVGLLVAAIGARRRSRA